MAPRLSIKEKALQAALDITAEKGWALLSLEDIAERIDVTLVDLQPYFENKYDILVAYGQSLDQEILDSVYPSEDDSEKDRLFELLMERFDLLNENRVAITSILQDFKSEPKHLCVSLPHISKSMAWLLDAASIDTYGLKGKIRTAGLTLIYLKTLRVWMSDDTSDLAKTMAELDKNLTHADNLVQSFAL